jgi:hypothetical protein
VGLLVGLGAVLGRLVETSVNAQFDNENEQDRYSGCRDEQ